jgi:sortase (surface protein transpeptidase)
VTAAVIPVGVDNAGAMVIPEQVSTLGWYRFSASPGATVGSIVIAGHVDSAAQGLGAFSRLRDAPVGARIELTGASGRVWTYRVVAREEFPKTTVPLGQLFSHYGAPRLTLVTCGGAFDAAARSYEDNIVVTALPALT